MHDDLIAINLDHLFPLLAHRRQMLAHHVRTSRVVILDPIANDVTEMAASEENELSEALPFDTLDEAFLPAVEVG